jgi:hypothetical protein
MPKRGRIPEANKPSMPLLSSADVEAAIMTEVQRIIGAIEMHVERLQETYDAKVTEIAAAAQGEQQATAARVEALEKRVRHLSELIGRVEERYSGAARPRPREEGEPASASADPAVPVVGRPSSVGVTGHGPKPPAMGVSKWLAAHRFEVIDRRDHPNGSLWVVGPRARLKPILDELRDQGVEFRYAAGGSRATGGRPGWFTKHRDG